MPTNYWIATSASNWNNASNWSLGHVPLAGEDVVFDDAYSNQNCTIDVNVGTPAGGTLRSITVSSTYTGTINIAAVQEGGLAGCWGATTISGGTITSALSNCGISECSSLTINGGTIKLGSTNHFRARGNTTITSGCNWQSGQVNLRLTTATLYIAPTITGLIIQNCTLTVNSNIQLTGDAVFDPVVGGAGTIDMGNYNLIIGGSLYVNAGTLKIGNGTLSVSGSASFGTSSAPNGYLNIVGNPTISISGTLTINATGIFGDSDVNYNLTTNGAITINSGGKFYAPNASGTWTNKGNLTFNSGAVFHHNNGTMTLGNNITFTNNSNNSHFNKIVFRYFIGENYYHYYITVNNKLEFKDSDVTADDIKLGSSTAWVCCNNYNINKSYILFGTLNYSTPTAYPLPTPSKLADAINIYNIQSTIAGSYPTYVRYDTDNVFINTLYVDKNATIKVPDFTDLYVAKLINNGVWYKASGYNGRIHLIGEQSACFDYNIIDVDDKGLVNILDMINIKD